MIGLFDLLVDVGIGIFYWKYFTMLCVARVRVWRTQNTPRAGHPNMLQQTSLVYLSMHIIHTFVSGNGIHVRYVRQVGIAEKSQTCVRLCSKQGRREDMGGRGCFLRPGPLKDVTALTSTGSLRVRLDSQPALRCASTTSRFPLWTTVVRLLSPAPMNN